MRVPSLLPCIVAAAIAFGAGTLPAEVVDVADNGFTVKLTVTVAAEPAKLRYAVGGYNPAGFKGLAPVVDTVLRSQLDRYKRYVDSGKP